MIYAQVAKVPPGGLKESIFQAPVGFSGSGAGLLRVNIRFSLCVSTDIIFWLNENGFRQTTLHGRKVIWVESLERLMEKDAQQRTAFLDLLRAIKNDTAWRLIITCRDYSAETVRSAFFGEVGLACADLRVSELQEVELDEVVAELPILQRPMSNQALRRILRKPFLLEMAAQMHWQGSDSLPTDERTSRQKVWRDIVSRVHEDPESGLPRLRWSTLVQVALRRERAMEPMPPAGEPAYPTT